MKRSRTQEAPNSSAETSTAAVLSVEPLATEVQEQQVCFREKRQNKKKKQKNKKRTSQEEPDVANLLNVQSAHCKFSRR